MLHFPLKRRTGTPERCVAATKKKNAAILFSVDVAPSLSAHTFTSSLPTVTSCPEDVASV